MAIVSVVAILIIIMMKLENPAVEANLNPENKEISNSTDTAGRSNSESGINRDEINQDEVNPANLNKPLVEQGNNKTDQDRTQQNIPVVKYGQLLVNVSPYAEVFIDGERIGLTPFTKPLVYQEGEHTIKLVHPDYPIYSDVVNVVQGETTRFRVSLESTIGYIRCRVAPWGNVYVNEDFKGTTPLQEKELIRVAPGPVRLVIKNPSYKDIDTAFTISRGDTLNFRFTFKK